MYAVVVALAVEVDGFEHAARVVEVVQAVAVGQFAVAQLAVRAGWPSTHVQYKGWGLGR